MRPFPWIVLALASCSTKRPVQGGISQSDTEARILESEEGRKLVQGVAPKAFPRVPDPDPAGAEVPEGYRVEVVLKGLEYPTSVEFDDAGNLYVAEAGFAYGDPAGNPRVLRVGPDGAMAVVADQLRGPITDLLWHDGKLWISHFATISTWTPGGGVVDVITDLPATWDHQNNQLTVGPDGYLYVGVGAATNSGVVGLDNVSPFLWLLFYPDWHDVPAKDVTLRDVAYTTPDPLTVLAHQGELVTFQAAAQHLVSPQEPLLVRTAAFHPFGRTGDRVAGQVKSNSSILRFRPDGSGLEVYAWGVRNPFGLLWHDGVLYATDNGYDERGSRPIANAPDCIWAIEQGAWYGFPDYACGRPVTEPEFASSRGPKPSFLLQDHPPVAKPVATRPPHSATTKLDASRSEAFGFVGQLFFGEVGSGTPVNAPGDVPSGYQVTRFDPKTGEMAAFFRLKAEAEGPEGYEHAVTPGPRRPVEARFSPNGGALYVVDFGALVAFPAGPGPLAHPYPGTGVVWRITREGAPASGPPANLSPVPARVQ